MSSAAEAERSAPALRQVAGETPAEAPRPPAPHVEPTEPPGYMPWLALWASLTVLIHAGLWTTGFPGRDLGEAVDVGAARAESRVSGEVGDDLIRKAVRTQRSTLPFWTVLSFLGDFLGGPAALGLRTIAVATAFSSLAAVRGRPIEYDAGLADCARIQGVWVLGLAVRAALMVALRRTEVDTSAALFLPPGNYPAALALGLQQADAFALVGWLAMAAGGRSRGQVGVPGALLVCGSCWAFESSVRVALGMVAGAGMRLSVMPG